MINNIFKQMCMTNDHENQEVFLIMIIIHAISKGLVPIKQCARVNQSLV